MRRLPPIPLPRKRDVENEFQPAESPIARAVAPNAKRPGATFFELRSVKWRPLRRAEAVSKSRQTHTQQSGRPGSNRRRPAWEAGILPTELRPRALNIIRGEAANNGAIQRPRHGTSGI